eukprot:1623270-Alexandrium_andersonii.AAC.1
MVTGLSSIAKHHGPCHTCELAHAHVLWKNKNMHDEYTLFATRPQESSMHDANNTTILSDTLHTSCLDLDNGQLARTLSA